MIYTKNKIYKILFICMQTEIYIYIEREKEVIALFIDNVIGRE